MPSSSNRSRVLENLALEAVSLTKEEFDEVVQLAEGPNIHES